MNKTAEAPTAPNGLPLELFPLSGGYAEGMAVDIQKKVSWQLNPEGQPITWISPYIRDEQTEGLGTITFNYGRHS